MTGTCDAAALRRLLTEGPYEPQAVEAALYADWEQAGLFHAEPDADREPFVIVMPPPNVTGALHMGHALTTAIEDAMIRWARMRGANAVWLPGTDHAGIATQNVVERELAAEGLTRHDLGREAFLERVWQWVRTYGGVILTQLRRLGASCDWQREAFTLDEPRSRAVREVFVSLYEQGLIYRGTRLINWCPRCATALSDIEVEHEEIDGELVVFRYPFVDGEGGIAVATTRAETMLGDTAVAVHPDDERYREAVGRRLRHPFFPDRELVVVADEAVDPEFGTGAVKVTPAHDPTDHAIAERHGLPAIDILTPEAVINDAGGPFAGLDRFEARRRVTDALRAQGLLVEVRPHRHAVGHCQRCGTIIEPRLSEQWFVAVGPLAQRAADAVRAGRTRFIPERFTGPFLDWLTNLHDWCISRQIWWGHRIPAWYCPEGHTTVARTDPDRCATCGSTDLAQDPDVLDTWFSSALWPFTTLGWPDRTPELQAWYPTTVLETGYDINTFWVSRMLMMGLWFLDEVPFRWVYNHGMVRDQYGKKMSKSFGNVIDPLEFTDRYGADALRFALLQHAAPGADVPLAEEWVEGARRFANKLWNATRLVVTSGEGIAGQVALPDRAQLTLEDRWILSRFEAAREVADEAYRSYDWPRAAEALYQFAWHELADWYLEAAKLRWYGEDPAARQVASAVAAWVLERLLRLLHPMMPFVTEALWRALTGADGGAHSLMVQAWPTAEVPRDPDAERDFGIIIDLVTELRRFRAAHRIPGHTPLRAVVRSDAEPLLRAAAPTITALGRLETLSFDGAVEPGSATVLFSRGEVRIPLRGVVDVAAELERLRAERQRAEAELGRAQRRLADRAFVERAPAEVVQRERDKEQEWRRTIEELDARIATYEQLV